MTTDTTAPAPAIPVSDFFSAMEARSDRWRQNSEGSVENAWLLFRGEAAD